MRNLKIDSTPDHDVYGQPDEDRVSLSEYDKQRDTFGAVGMDDYVSVDKVIGGNGSRYFVTRAD